MVLQHPHTTPHGFLLSWGIDWAGDSSQWDIFHGKGLPLITRREMQTPGQSWGQERLEALWFGTNDWRASSSHLGWGWRRNESGLPPLVPYQGSCQQWQVWHRQYNCHQGHLSRRGTGWVSVQNHNPSTWAGDPGQVGTSCDVVFWNQRVTRGGSCRALSQLHPF